MDKKDAKKKEEVKTESKKVEEIKEKSEAKELIKTDAKKGKKGSFLLGIIGALLGGIIGAIPWILMYIYGNMMLSILAVVIAAGTFYGYKLFNGKISKVLPIVIMVVSVLVVALATFVFIPMFYLHSEGLAISISSIKSLYMNSEFLNGILKDAGIAVIFTLLGASVIAGNIRRKLANPEVDIDLSNKEELNKIKNEAIEKVEPIFERFNSFDKEHGISKDELEAEVEEDVKLKVALNQLKSFGIVKRAKGKFYYSKEAEDKQISPKKKVNSKVITIVIAVILILTMCGVIVYNGIKNNKPIEVTDDLVSFKVSSSWEEYTNFYNSGWDYFKYINTTPPTENEVVEDDDYEKYPAYISVGYYDIDKEELPSLEAVQSSMKEYIMSLESTPETYEEEITKTKNNIEVLKLKMIFLREPEQVEYAYYILNDDKLACIDGYSFSLADDNEIKEEVQRIADSFKWN